MEQTRSLSTQESKVVLALTVKGSDLGTAGGKLVLDFNFAYNPSCSYDPRWDCPLAPPSNWLRPSVEAGERYP